MESKRLFFREINAEDAEKIVEWRSDYESYRYFLSPHKLTLEEHLNWYNNSYLNNNNRTDYIAVEKESGRSAGVFGMIILGNTVEVNYLLGKEFRGKGYAGEAVDCLISQAKELGCDRAVAEVHAENEPSLALARRLGFKQADKKGDIIFFEKSI